MFGRRIFTISLGILTAGALAAQEQEPTRNFADESTSFRIAINRITAELPSPVDPPTPVEPAATTLELNVTLTLTHSGERPLALTFPTSQDFDIAVWNSNGEIVHTWSTDKVFLPMIREISFTGQRAWSAMVPLADLPPGRYIVDGWLTTADNKAYRATAPLVIDETPLDIGQ